MHTWNLTSAFILQVQILFTLAIYYGKMIIAVVWIDKIIAFYLVFWVNRSFDFKQDNLVRLCNM